MPVVPINYLAVVVAALSSIVLGFLWYGPLFGKQWMALMGISQSDHSLVFASSYLDASGWNAGLMAGFWNWLGFVAPVTLSSVLWEGRSWKLWVLNNCYQLLALLIMGVILAVWLP